MCALSASKSQIKEAFKRLYNTKIRSVNTMITPQGKKKAYIRLSADSDSLSLANKIGIIWWISFHKYIFNSWLVFDFFKEWRQKGFI
jgi:ribosomal protein L23